MRDARARANATVLEPSTDRWSVATKALGQLAVPARRSVTKASWGKGPLRGGRGLLDFHIRLHPGRSEVFDGLCRPVGGITKDLRLRTQRLDGPQDVERHRLASPDPARQPWPPAHPPPTPPRSPSGRPAHPTPHRRRQPARPAAPPAPPRPPSRTPPSRSREVCMPLQRPPQIGEVLVGEQPVAFPRQRR